MKKAYVILRLCLPATILLGGCMTTGLYETAHSAPPGAAEHTFALETAVVLRDSSGLSGPWQDYHWPVPLYALRFGLFRNCDVGIRLGLPTLGLSAKYAFWDGEPAVAFVANAAGSFFIMPMAFWATGRQLNGRLIISGGTDVFGYAASVGAGYRQEKFDGEGRSDDEQSWDIIAGAGLPITIGERVRIMPALSVDLPVWSRRIEQEWQWEAPERTSTWLNRDLRRLTVSLGISVSLIPELNYGFGRIESR